MKGYLKKIGKVWWATIEAGKTQIGIDENGKPKFKRNQKRINTHCERKPDAEKVLIEIINQVNNNTFVNPEKITFSQFLMDWIENHAKQNCEATTYQGYKLIVEKHIIPYFKESVLLQKLQPVDLQNYYNYKLKSGRADGKGGLSANTVWKHHANIHKALEQAVNLKIIKMNPADNVELPKKKKYTAKFYTDKQMLKLLELAKDTQMETVIYLGGLLGLRRGEIIGLKWDNVDFDKKEITINETRVRFNGKAIEKKPKNETSERTLVAPEHLIKYLKQVRKKQYEKKLLCGNTYNNAGYVCCTFEGTPLDPSNVDRKFKEITKEAGLPEIRLHDLRHSNASLLLKLGSSMKEIQVWLGHKQLSTTADIYSHVDMEMKKKSASKIDGLFKEKKKAN